VSGVRRDRPARIKKFVIDPIALRIVSDNPSTLSVWELPLQCLLQAVQHSDAFLVSSTKRPINFGRDVTLSPLP
jgi:hypothetical protein